MRSVPEWYAKHLQVWVESYLAELVKGVLVLFGLAVFRISIIALKWTGLDGDNLALLENLHFWIQYATIAVLGMYSVIKLIAAML
jgi:hypothetical protein